MIHKRTHTSLTLMVSLQLMEETQSAAVVAQMKNDVTNSHLRDFNQHARVHAEAFRKILIATGLSRESDVIERWHNREQYVNEVEQQVRTLHTRLAELVEENQEFTAELRSGKFKPQLETAKNRAELVRAAGHYMLVLLLFLRGFLGH